MWSRAVVLAAVLVVTGAAPAGAVCVAGSEKLSSVDRAFEGVAQPGPTGLDGELLSPARFRVSRWIKGAGPSEVEVPTAVRRQGDLYMVVSEGIHPRPSERWVVMLRGESAACTGSRVLRPGEEAPEWDPTPLALRAAPALGAVLLAGSVAWSVRRRRRPVIQS